MTSSFTDDLKSLMCPPGNGVYTVNTAKERKNLLHQAIFGVCGDETLVHAAWVKDLEKIQHFKNTLMLGICSDNGGGILRGANWGPLFLRNELLQSNSDANYLDLGDIRVIPHLLHDKYLNEETLRSCRAALYGKEDSSYSVSPLSITLEVMKILYSKLDRAGFFALGGDHSVSYPLVRSYLEYSNLKKRKVGLLHFDAHTDLLVKRLGIDLCFGSWVTHILPFLQEPSLAVQVGIRSTGKPKEYWEKNFGVIQYWSSEINKQKTSATSQKIIEHYQSKGVTELYVSFDIDALDKEFASATGTPEAEGLTPDTCARIIDDVSKYIPIACADMVEVAPFLNTNDGKTPEPDTTLMFASSLSNLLIEKINHYLDS